MRHTLVEQVSPNVQHITGSLTHLDEHGRASMVDIGEKPAHEAQRNGIWPNLQSRKTPISWLPSSYPTEERKESPGSPDEKAFAKARRREMLSRSRN